MKFAPLFAALFITVGVAALYGTANAQGLAVTASGKKTFTLNNKVGANQILWHSSAPAEEIKGTADDITGSISFDPKKPTGLKGTINVAVASMKSGNKTRDEHLRSEMWLEDAKYPSITFTITSVSNLKFSKNEMQGNATGKFTMHGVTKTLTVPFSLQYVDQSAQTQARAAGDLVMITANFNVSLKDFNVKGREGIIGSKVGESIKLSAKLYGASGK